MTSLNMPGFSLTLLLLPAPGDPYSSDELLRLLDAPASAPGWKWSASNEPGVIGAKVEEPQAKKSKEVDLASECKAPRRLQSRFDNRVT